MTITWRVPLLTCCSALVLSCSPPPNPIVNGNRVTLVLRAESGQTTPGVTGDFTGWIPKPATPMARSGWFEFQFQLEPDARVEYLIAYGPTDFRVDRRNPRRVPSVGGQASEILMAEAERHPEVVGSQPPRAGVLEERAFPLPGGGSRRVMVYTPAQSDRESAGTASLPIAYFHDGALMVEKGSVPSILDRLIVQNRLAPLRAVFVDTPSRAEEYNLNPEFREWFVSTLVPAIEGTLAFPPPARAVIGVSRGAIAAIDLAWHHPDLFSRCGLLIPSIYPTDLPEVIASSPAKPLRFAMVTARYDTRWLSEGRALQKAMESRGYQLTYREVPEGHNVQTWRAHLDDVLIGLGFGGT